MAGSCSADDLDRLCFSPASGVTAIRASAFILFVLSVIQVIHFKILYFILVIINITISYSSLDYAQQFISHSLFNQIKFTSAIF